MNAIKEFEDFIQNFCQNYNLAIEVFNRGLQGAEIRVIELKLRKKSESTK